jgi:site-specific DNA-methyltransferase (adenine-specific)
VSKEKEDYYNQIPEKVIGNIIKIVANESDIIFDPFMGSGTIPAVASKLGYKYIATDISEKAFNITNKRLSKIENNLFTI